MATKKVTPRARSMRTKAETQAMVDAAQREREEKLKANETRVWAAMVRAAALGFDVRFAIKNPFAYGATLLYPGFDIEFPMVCLDVQGNFSHTEETTEFINVASEDWEFEVFDRSMAYLEEQRDAQKRDAVRRKELLDGLSAEDRRILGIK
ncbi:hypothetical protein H1O16_gp120 [Burkholderia phage BcepSaruman]|uniref:Uncharacterized protein n=1 Tax=Burkholderia phage BcepSaruman TaxID=2530032 RepID=A0A4D5ZBZ8_9CAUD|nr:hypothetical protein H1O16_gp120 [Burkholderia phage BcepSaruman]QBX06533.1 hypothetical protein BcepSaruman_120 [Burkholderia phage BcepSaruman]